MPLLQFKSAHIRWWRKPLVRVRGRRLPAELAVLALQIKAGETGAWLNSRGVSSGVVDLIPDAGSASGFRTQRAKLPSFVVTTLRRLYHEANLTKGCPDLVIWSASEVRLVEVKCPHWDRPSPEQTRFMRVAARLGVATRVVEWEFGDVNTREHR